MSIHNAGVVKAPHALISGASEGGGAGGAGGRSARVLRLLWLLVLTYVAGYLFGGVLESSPLTLRTYFNTTIYNATRPSIRISDKTSVTWPKPASTKDDPETKQFINKFNVTLNVTEKKMPEVVSQVHNITANATVQSGFRETSTYNGTLMIITKVLKRTKHSLIAEDDKPPLPFCRETPMGLGPVPVNVSDMELDLVQMKYHEVQWGGVYIPPNCTARHKVAIIVPYRNREQNLPVFLNHIHPFLMKQEIEYGIFLVEQDGGLPFNRGKLLNVGFVESQWLQSGYQCFLLHDVDLLPLDTRNMYTCMHGPQHMSVNIDKYNGMTKEINTLPPFYTSFGGVSMVTMEQFTKANGFSNRYWGWGAEDDDLYIRLKEVGYPIASDDSSIARYAMLDHSAQEENPARFDILSEVSRTFQWEGLSTLDYELIKIVQYHLYTHIVANID